MKKFNLTILYPGGIDGTGSYREKILAESVEIEGEGKIYVFYDENSEPIGYYPVQYTIINVYEI